MGLHPAHMGLHPAHMGLHTADCTQLTACAAAPVTSPGSFLAWEFELTGANGGTMALIDRNFQGFTKEIFTDAGKYVIHFGGKIADMAASSAQQAAAGAEEAGSTAAGQLPAAAAVGGPPVTPLAVARTDVAVIPTMSGNQLVRGPCCLHCCGPAPCSVLHFTASAVAAAWYPA